MTLHLIDKPHLTNDIQYLCALTLATLRLIILSMSGDILKEDWFTPEALAVKLGQCETTLAKWRTRGGGPKYIKVGRKVFYPASFVEDFLTTMSIVTPNLITPKVTALAPMPFPPKRTPPTDRRRILGSRKMNREKELMSMKVVEINDELLMNLYRGGVQKFSRNLGFHKVGEGVYRLDIPGDDGTDLSREFAIIYFEVVKAEPPSNVKIIYSHHEHEERDSKQVRWKIVRMSYQPLDRDLKRTIVNAVIWAWGRYSLDLDANSWTAVKSMNPDKFHSEDVDEESS